MVGGKPYRLISKKIAVTKGPSKCFSILFGLIITILVFYILIDFAKDSKLSLKIDSSVIVKNYWPVSFWSSNGNNNESMNEMNLDFQNNGSSENNEMEIPIFEKYISCTYSTCSGLGNQMFRFASLYSIGQNFNRSAFFSSENKCQRNTMPEIKEIFPNFYKTIKMLTPPPSNETIKSDFALDCCEYQNPNTLHDYPQKYLILNGNYLQSYKYFHHRKEEIRYFFNSGTKVHKSVEAIGEKTFGNDVSHKLCIHIRRGDFIKHEQLESGADFVEPSIEFVHKNLTEKGISNISLIFLGIDDAFIKDLNYNQSHFHGIYHPKIKSRGEDMHFGIRYCDTLVITASGSTFAWWIGYLMKEGSQIFYNAQISKQRNYIKDYFDYDIFPPEWNMLELRPEKKIVEIDNRWFYEKFSWPRNGIPPVVG